MNDNLQTPDTGTWKPDFLKADLCTLYGHGECGGHEVDDDANIIACTCWCHSEEIAHT